MIRIDSILLSKYILQKIGGTDAFKLQKILFFIESFHLATFNYALVDDEFEAWVNGPVSRRVYDYFKDISKGQNIIPAPKKDNITNQALVEHFQKSPKQLALIDAVITHCNQYDSAILRESSHSTPWKNIRKGLSKLEKSGKIIPKESIRFHYRKLLLEGNTHFLKTIADTFKEDNIQQFFYDYEEAWKVLAR